MPVAPLFFRSVCGGFLPVYLTFMLKRARFRAAMNHRVLTLRNRMDGVMTGVLLFLLYMGNLIHQCGDIELNPGPPKQDALRQTRLMSSARRRNSTDSVTANTRHDMASPARPPASSPTADLTLADLMTKLNGMDVSLNTKLDEVVSDVATIKQRFGALQEEVEVLRQEVDLLRKENQMLKDHGDDLSSRVKNLEKKTDDLEGRSKRNNLIFYGMKKEDGETNASCECQLKKLFSDRLGLSDSIEMDRVHRLSNKPDSPIIARLTFYKDKVRILKERTKLKGSQIFIGEDFSMCVRDIRKKLAAVMKIKRSEGKRVSMVYDHLFIEGKKYCLADDGVSLREIK